MANPVPVIPVGPHICQSCGNTGRAATHVPGSFLIELLLWCFMCFPGLIYSIWRHTSARACCPVCRGHMIPSNSPAGYAQLRNLYGQGNFTVPSARPRSGLSFVVWILIAMAGVVVISVISGLVGAIGFKPPSPSQTNSPPQTNSVAE